MVDVKRTCRYAFAGNRDDGLGGASHMAGRLVIVGAGQAAFALAAKLRSLKDDRPITIIGSEDVLPYQRPPLSKKVSHG